MILVVGATGQLGAAVVRLASERGLDVRALVRSGADDRHLRGDKVECCTGDLRDPASLFEACEGVDEVVATATVVFPRGRYSFEADEDAGYANLIAACEAQGVAQILFTSILAFPEPYVSEVPTLRFKRAIERRLQASRVACTILRAGPFMDDYFALMGSAIPLRGAEAPTLGRPFWMSRAHLALTSGLIARHGVALTPRPPDLRHGFVALEDVAHMLVRAIGAADAMDACFDVRGPQALSWTEVAASYAQVLGRRVRTLSPLPGAALRWAARALRPLSPAAANQLGILWALSEYSTAPRDAGEEPTFGVRLTSAEDFLRAHVAARIVVRS